MPDEPVPTFVGFISRIHLGENEEKSLGTEKPFQKLLERHRIKLVSATLEADKPAGDEPQRHVS